MKVKEIGAIGAAAALAVGLAGCASSTATDSKGALTKETAPAMTSGNTSMPLSSDAAGVGSGNGQTGPQTGGYTSAYPPPVAPNRGTNQ